MKCVGASARRLATSGRTVRPLVVVMSIMIAVGGGHSSRANESRKTDESPAEKSQNTNESQADAARETNAARETSAAPRSGVARDRLGAFVHTLQSPFQDGETRVRVLVPREASRDNTQDAPVGRADKSGPPWRVVYVLPVEPKDERRYGDGLREIHQLDLQNRYGAVFVAPEFSQLPWYADHPTDAKVRQESYLIKSVVPLVEQHYPVLKNRDGRLLLGFSKSGWGAWSVLLRHPDLFARAAAWDAPVMMDRPGKYGSGPIFGTDENFTRYQLSRLVAEPAKLSGDTARLILTGYGNFRSEHQQMHALLQQSGVKHVYRDGPPLKHDWHSGWVAEAVALLMTEP